MYTKIWFGMVWFGGFGLFWFFWEGWFFGLVLGFFVLAYQLEN